MVGSKIRVIGEPPVAANCRYNYDDLLYTANMYYYATTYLSYKRCNLTLSMTIRSRLLFVVLSYRWTTTKVLHISRTKDVSNFEYDNFVVLELEYYYS